MNCELVEYFARRDSPSANSSVGRAIQMLAEIRPGVPLEDLRKEANERMHSKRSGQISWTKDEREAIKKRNL